MTLCLVRDGPHYRAPLFSGFLDLKRLDEVRNLLISDAVRH
jgi:hypothetical protein